LREEGAVAGEDGEERLRDEKARQQPDGGTGVAAVQDAVALGKAVAATTADTEGSLVQPAPVDTQATQAVQRGQAVSGALEALDHSLAAGDSVKDGSAMRDRLIAGEGDRTAERADGTDKALHRSSPAVLLFAFF